MIKQRYNQRGAAMLIFVILFVVAGSALTTLLARSMFTDVAALNELTRSKQAYLTSESLLEDMSIRLISGSYSVNTTEELTLASSTAQATSSYDGILDEYSITSAGQRQGAYRMSQIVLEVSGGTAFNYGLQAGNGGISMTNSASIIGNAFANGDIVGQGSSLIRGDVISAGPTGLIDNVTATGSAYAVTISNSEIGGNAYAETITIGSAGDSLPGGEIVGDVEAYTLDIGSGNQVDGNVTAYEISGGSILGDATYCVRNSVFVGGTPTSGSCGITAPAYQATSAFPIPNDLIEAWKQNIEDTGTVVDASGGCSSGTYVIDTDTTLGNVKIECNLEIQKKGAETRVTLDGPLWVEGDILFKSGPIIEVDSALGRRSVQVIADNESNRLTSSRISVENSTEFYGVAGEDSYVLLLSMNESAEQSGPEIAINLGQSSAGDLLVYAPHGLLDIGQSIEIKEATAYQIDIGNNSDVIYESGLANMLFTGGPGGGYAIADWSETY